MQRYNNRMQLSPVLPRMCAVVALVCAWAPGAARASQVRPLSLAELVRVSDATVLGHTIEQHSFWQGTRILTAASVAVDELWAGTVRGAGTIDVVTPGGVVGEWGQRVDGAADLARYGRMVLHLRQVEGEYTPTAMAQGVWSVSALWGDHAAVTRDASVQPPRALLQGLLPLASRQELDVGGLRALVMQLARLQDGGGR